MSNPSPPPVVCRNCQTCACRSGQLLSPVRQAHAGRTGRHSGVVGEPSGDPAAAPADCGSLCIAALVAEPPLHALLEDGAHGHRGGHYPVRRLANLVLAEPCVGGVAAIGERITMNAGGEPHRATLQRIARRVMVERGLLPDFSAAALAELGRIQARRQPATARFAISGNSFGLPSTTTTPATWTSLPWPRPCPASG